MTDPATLIAATKAVIDGLKALADIAKKKKDPDLMAAVTDLQGKVVEQGSINLALQGEIHTLREEKATLKRQLEELKAANDLRAEMYFRNNAYWRRPKGATGQEDGPFCVACMDAQTKAHRIQAIGGGYSFCPVCKNKFSGVE